MVLFCHLQVLWRFKGKALEKLGANVMTKDWLPQLDIMAHQNIKLFITHEGSHSMQVFCLVT